MKINKINDCNETISDCVKGIAHCVSQYTYSSETMQNVYELHIGNNLDRIEHMVKEMRKEIEKKEFINDSMRIRHFVRDSKKMERN